MKVSGSMSRYTGRAPTRAIVPPVAKNVYGDVMTSSPGAEVVGHQRDQERVGARRQPDAVLRAAIRGDLRLELLDRGPEDEVLRGRDVQERGVDARP